MRRLALALAVACFQLVTSAVASATTIQVPIDQPTIQFGVDAASDGDTILVHPGTYVENVVLHRKDVCLRSAGGPEVTIIDGSLPEYPDSASTVRFMSSNGSIEGFDIRNGQGTFLGNWPVGGGIAVAFDDQEDPGSGPLISGNWIHANGLTGDGRTEGAGVFVMGEARLFRNRIYDNVLESLGAGTGSAVAARGWYGVPQRTEVVECEVFDNHNLVPDPANQAGTISVVDAIIQRNIVACNEAGYPSALSISKIGNIESNTIVGNYSILNLPAVRLGVRFASGDCPGESNISFALNNVTHNVGPGVECVDCIGSPHYVVECNNFVANYPGGQVTGLCADAIGQDGNISVDPLYGRSGCPHTIGGWCLSENSPLLLDPPPGCGLIGALGLCPPVGIHDVRPQSPPRLQVRAPRPNPFLERTTIPFYLPRSGEVSVGIYDVMGRRVRALEPGWRTAGDDTLEWDGRDDAGRRVPSGAYVARIGAGGEELTRTLLLIR